MELFHARACKIFLRGCSKTIEEENSGSGANVWFQVFYLVLGVYGGLQFVLALLLRIPWFRQQAKKCSNFYILTLIKWVHQVMLQSRFLFLQLDQLLVLYGA